jgi:hypothetical protein
VKAGSVCFADPLRTLYLPVQIIEDDPRLARRPETLPSPAPQGHDPAVARRIRGPLPRSRPPTLHAQCPRPPCPRTRTPSVRAGKPARLAWSTRPHPELPSACPGPSVAPLRPERAPTRPCPTAGPNQSRTRLASHRDRMHARPARYTSALCQPGKSAALVQRQRSRRAAVGWGVAAGRTCRREAHRSASASFAPATATPAHGLVASKPALRLRGVAPARTDIAAAVRRASDGTRTRLAKRVHTVFSQKIRHTIPDDSTAPCPAADRGSCRLRCHRHASLKDRPSSRRGLPHIAPPPPPPSPPPP